MRSTETFIEYLKVNRRYSPRTLEIYRGSICEFYDFLSPSAEESEEDLLLPAQIRGFIAESMKSGLSSRTINLKLSAISSYCNFLVKRGVIKANPVKRVQRPKEVKRLPEFYTTSAMDSYFNSEFERDDLFALRDRLVVTTLYCTGMRRAELASLRISDWDRSRSIFRVTGKGDKVREIPVPDSLVPHLDTYLSMLESYYSDNEKKRLFLTDTGQPMYLSFVNKIVKRELSSSKGISGRKTPHILRHSFATHLLNNGADLNSIKEVLGHSSLAATQVYTHNSFENLKKIFLTAHPRAKKGG